MARPIILFFSAILVSFTLGAQEKTEIWVAAYPFQPYYWEKAGHQGGLLPELLDMLNAAQDKWNFRIKTIPANRRYLTLEEGSSHLIFFEDEAWEWKDRNVQFSELLLKDSEKFLTLRKHGRDQAFFEGAELRPLVVVRGYHYRFADFMTDDVQMRKRFQVALVQSQELLMEALRLGRGETALITSSYFALEASGNPALDQEFLLSEKKDQDYNLRIVFSRTYPFTPKDWELLYSHLKNRGHWNTFFRTRGLEGLLP